MKTFLAPVCSAVLALAAGCGSDTSSLPPPDADGNPTDAGSDAPPTGRARPTWQLEDVQPLSARVGQTYGLEAYSEHVVVVTLVEGF